MRKVIFLIILIFTSAGCATYNAQKDPVYQSYLRGEITYDTYVQHVNNLNARRLNTINAIQQFNKDYQNRQGTSTTTDCYYIGNRLHCDSKEN